MSQKSTNFVKKAIVLAETVLWFSQDLGLPIIEHMGAEELLESAVSETSGIEMRLKKVIAESGGPASLARSVLSMVANQTYDHAKKEVETYVDMKEEYPDFREFTKRYVERVDELMDSIREKRSIPGVENMSMAKKQAINDSIVALMEDLKTVLKKMEQVEYSQRMADLRSTLIVVKTLSWCVLGIVVLAFAMEVYNGLYSTTSVVADDMLNDVVDWTFDKMGL